MTGSIEWFYRNQGHIYSNELIQQQATKSNQNNKENRLLF